MPITRHREYLYAMMNFPSHTFYTTPQLRKYPHQFSNPSATKLYILLKRAGLKAVKAEILQRLEEIESNFDHCKRIKNTPLLFRVSIGHGDVGFNTSAYINIMDLDRNPMFLQLVS